LRATKELFSDLKASFNGLHFYHHTGSGSLFSLQPIIILPPLLAGVDLVLGYSVDLVLLGYSAVMDP
jgi:hypothetical protein